MPECSKTARTGTCAVFYKYRPWDGKYKVWTTEICPIPDNIGPHIGCKKLFGD